MNLRAIRGAIQVGANTPEEIASGVKELLPAILEANGLSTQKVISVLLTCTPDLNAAFPAASAREIGFGAVPLLCAVEMDVPGALPLVIRVMLHAEMAKEPKHIYLRGATVLRKDIAQ
ncbi:MAG: chorismate mutase [Candidatus Nanopelagicaceae bacterium]